MRQTRWLPGALWPVGIVVVAWGLALLFSSDGEISVWAVVSRSVGGSFIACGLIAWQRRPEIRIGPLMTATGFLFAVPAVLAEIDWPPAYTLGEILASWWVIPFSILVLGYPSGRLTARIDQLIVAGFVISGAVLQVVWLLFLPFPEGRENVILVAADPGVADVIDTFQRGMSGSLGVLLAVLGITRWLRAAPPLQRLLLPMLAGSVAALILGGQGIYRVLSGDWMRASAELTAVVLVAVPLAFLFGILRAQLARAGTADLVLALRDAPDAPRLQELLGRALGDPSVRLFYWLPGFECFVDDTGTPATLPLEGSGRTATVVKRDGEPVAAVLHDAALDVRAGAARGGLRRG